MVELKTVAADFPSGPQLQNVSLELLMSSL